MFWLFLSQIYMKITRLHRKLLDLFLLQLLKLYPAKVVSMDRVT